MQALSHDIPSLSGIMQPQDPDELLEMIVEDRVVHPHIDVLNCVCDDTVAGHGVRRGFDPGRLAQRLWMHADTAKVADDKSENARWLSVQGKAHQGVLWVCLEPNSVDEHWWKECCEEDSDKTRREIIWLITCSRGEAK